MCLLLQGFLFDGSRVDADKFRAAQRPISCPTHGTEPPYPLLAANALLSGLKESLGSQEGTGNHTWCPVPFCPCRWAPTSLGRGDGQSHLQRRAAVSAEGLPSTDGKEFRGGDAPWQHILNSDCRVHDFIKLYKNLAPGPAPRTDCK